MKYVESEVLELKAQVTAMQKELAEIKVTQAHLVNRIELLVSGHSKDRQEFLERQMEVNKKWDELNEERKRKSLG